MTKHSARRAFDVDHIVLGGIGMGKTASVVTPSKINWAEVVAPLTAKRSKFKSTDIVTKKGEGK
ncbi:MAG: hypothetical protein ING69_10500 [Rhodocyclaceae bacterium]|nr:hypothetical protein [Rhodocyclaceae bacterium]